MQIAATWVNVGTVGWLTVTVIVAVVAQAPEAGVNVYAVVAVLLIAGAHVPAIELLDVEGNANVLPLHIAATWVNVGVTGWLIVKFKVATESQPTAFVPVQVYVPLVV